MHVISPQGYYTLILGGGDLWKILPLIEEISVHSQEAGAINDHNSFSGLRGHTKRIVTQPCV